jgi:hypothetical protein
MFGQASAMLELARRIAVIAAMAALAGAMTRFIVG